jgi:hypothetical protein
LQETVEPRSSRTVLSSLRGKLDVDEGFVLSQPYDVCGRRDCPDRTADAHLVENVQTWRMDSVRRQNLIAPQWVLVQEQD